MLSVSELSESQSTALFSPSKHPFMRRINARRFCFDPYKGIFGKPTAANPKSPLRSQLPSQGAPKSPTTATRSSADAIIPQSTTPRPTVPQSTKQPRPHYVIVDFKKTTGQFRAPFRVSVGDLVVVEGDRGENIGSVKSITTEEPEEEVKVKVLRRANAADRDAFAKKNEEEVKTMEEVKKAASNARLNATVVDIEYQFDMKKLTIFVERASSSTFVDFRKLQRLLFRQFRCRIWCVYTDEI